MNVAFVTSSLSPAVGGPFESVGGLARGLAALPDTRVRVIGVAPAGTRWQDHESNWRGCLLDVHQGSVITRFTSASRAIEAWSRGDPEGMLHFGELWNVIAALEQAAARTSSGVIVHSPRGMLEPWALRHRARRKRCAWLVAQRRSLARVSLFHVTSVEEGRSVRTAGFRQPLAVIPNGVRIMEPAVRPLEPATDRLAVALGRLHPKKGFMSLIEAWHRVAEPAWRLVIAGPDENGHAAELRAAIAALGCSTIEVSGPKYGEDRKALLDRAHLSICSSYSENFGIVVAEAMERSLAVVTTTGTPWRHLASGGMGWCVPPGVAGISAALEEALALPQWQLDAMGAAGRLYVEQHLGWPGIARKMRSVYDWLRGGGPPPPCVEFA